MVYLFFFQAEDGIRDTSVTGVQTYALPISFRRQGQDLATQAKQANQRHPGTRDQGATPQSSEDGLDVLIAWRGGKRSEERRVGKECRTRWWPYQQKKHSESKRAHHQPHK